MIWKLKRLLNVGSERQLKRAIRLINTLVEEVLWQCRKLDNTSSHDLISRFMSLMEDNYVQVPLLSLSSSGMVVMPSPRASPCTFFLLSWHSCVVAGMCEEIAAITKGQCDRGRLDWRATILCEDDVQFDSKFCVEEDVLHDDTFVSRNTRVTYRQYVMDAAWCVCRSDVSSSMLQKALDYACGAGADCTQIIQNGPCYNPNTVLAHCSYAVNSYYQRKGQAQGSCDFSSTATLTTTDPGGNGCTYPASPRYLNLQKIATIPLLKRL
ncbi:hypothetical protein Cni_G03141 [Canna indica]|uniref:X8 domain-containing protein n=1 Tax=Canna indica TaxID=4628 RepID=A0AAQ3JT12_9LILI|nr:hypothetical protein Cni_G03141 [Canna indica]